MGVKRFVWDELSDNVLLETDETDTVTARYCQRPERFGELLFQDRGGTKSYNHYDGNASTCNLTDDSESVTDTTVFSAYGENVSSSGSTANPFGYKGAVGYYTNESTGDIYVRNRSYEPAIGRWLSEDPIWFNDVHLRYQWYFKVYRVDRYKHAISGQSLALESLTFLVPYAFSIQEPQRRRRAPGWFRCTNRIIPVGTQTIELECDCCQHSLRIDVGGYRCHRYDPKTGDRVEPEDDPENTYVRVQIRIRGTIECDDNTQTLDTIRDFEMPYGCLIAPDLQNAFDEASTPQGTCTWADDFQDFITSATDCR